jgi:hypothetical protein
MTLGNAENDALEAQASAVDEELCEGWMRLGACAVEHKLGGSLLGCSDQGLADFPAASLELNQDLGGHGVRVLTIHGVSMERSKCELTVDLSEAGGRRSSGPGRWGRGPDGELQGNLDGIPSHRTGARQLEAAKMGNIVSGGAGTALVAGTCGAAGGGGEGWKGHALRKNPGLGFEVMELYPWSDAGGDIVEKDLGVSGLF